MANRLLLLIPTFGRGGAEDYALRVAVAARQRGWTVDAGLWRLPATASLADDLASAGARVHELLPDVRPNGESAGVAATARATLATLRLLHDVRADRALLVLPFVESGFSAIVAAAIARVPLTVVFQLVKEHARFGAVRRAVCRWARERDQVWVAVSENNRQLLARHFSAAPDEFALVYNAARPMSPEILTPEARVDARRRVCDRLGLSDRSQIVVTVGALRYQKGHDLLLSAIPVILRDHPEARFVCVGEGDRRTELEGAIDRAGLRGVMQLVGHHHDVATFLAAADVFAFPTRLEGSPFALLEAMAAEVPIVTTNASGILEVVNPGEHAFVCEVDNADALAAAVHDALSDGERARTMARRARDRATLFSDATMLGRTLDIIERRAPGTEQLVVRSGSGLRTLIIGAKLLNPPAGGSALRNLQNIQAFSRLGPVATFTAVAKPYPGDATPAGVARAILIVPRRALRSRLEHRVARATRRWRTLGHPYVDIHYTRRGARALSRLLAEFSPHIVVFEEIWMHRYLSLIDRQACRVVFDAHNVEGQLRRELAGDNNSDNAALAARALAIEADHVGRADHVWVCSEADARALTALYPDVPPVSVVPNTVDVDSYAMPPPRRRTGAGDPVPLTVLFSGTFSYRPNAAAADRLINEILPRVSARVGRTRLLLAGRDPTDVMRAAAARNADIIVTGWVHDIRPLLGQADVVVVPLQHGGGTRLKILEAFAAGRPVISSAKGAEGLDVVDGVHLLVRDTPDQIAEAVEDLQTRPEFAAQLVEAAATLVRERYSWQAAARTIHRAVAVLTASHGNPIEPEVADQQLLGRERSSHVPV